MKLAALATAVLLLAANAKAATCVALQGVLQTPAIKRLADQDLAAFLRWFNAQPPATDYDGPVWFFDVPEADRLAFGVLRTDEIVCFAEVGGATRAEIWRAVRGI